MISVARIDLREISLPLREPFQISSGTMVARRCALLQLTDSEGHTCWSECVADDAPNYLPETIDTAWIAITKWIAPRILGRTFEAPSEIHAALGQNIRGHEMAKAAVEMGIWGLHATALEMPLARLIGGVRTHVDVGISLGIQPTPDALVERVGAALKEGYRKVKIKIKPGSDVAFVAAARAAFPDAPLMADANNAYTMDDLAALQALDALNLMMIEQPLAWDDIVRHRDLQAVMRTPICLDESITSLAKAQDMVTLGSGRIINIKPGRVGGFTSSIRIHDFCEANGIPVWCGGMLETGIGRAYNVALASLSNFTKPGDVSPSARYWARDIVTPEWTMSADGTVAVPLDRPGIGVEVNHSMIDDLTLRMETLRA